MRSPWFMRVCPSALIIVCSFFVLASCSGDPEPVKCKGGGKLYTNPVVTGTEVFCRLDDKVAHGAYSFEDTQGNTVITGEFFGGQASGDWTWWHPGGQVISQTGGFEFGLASGLWTGFDLNGTPRWEHSFAQGIGCGTWSEWDEQGELTGTIDYLPCDGSSGLDPTGALVIAPEEVETWDGLMCPPPTSMVFGEGDPNARWCQGPGGAREGDFGRWFSADGPGSVKQEAGQYAQGKRTGTWTTWNSEGSVISQGSFAEDKEDGDWWWWREGGMPRKQGTFSAGLPSGTWTAWYPGGLAEWEGSYKDGLEQGDWTWWWEDGLIREQSSWSGGQRQGEYKSFYRGGAANEVGEFDKGRKTGAWQGFWPGGTLWYEGEYGSGWRQGLWRWWNEDGSPDMEGSYVDQNPVGDWTVWDVDDSLGLTLRGVGPFDQGERNGVWTWTWEEAGTLESEVLYLHNLREGPWVSYWPDGVVRVEGQFIAGLGEFTWKFYYQNGVLSLEESVHEGILDGESTAWWENGQMKSQGVWNMGKKVGQWTYWDENGNQTGTETFDEWGYPK